jgi:NAD(P)-dependent dehydrogenase (short-subunit alcohol dehydrogenase family)
MALPRSPAVLVTGCSSGIGRATAERLAARGMAVWASARRVETLADLGRRGCRTLALDVTDEASMVHAVRAVEEAHGHVGALVNNAGYSQSGAVESVPMADVRRQFETNVFGLLRLSQLVLPGMRAAGAGRIVNVSSMGGRFSLPGGGAYHATKHAVEALSDALRFEVAGFGVDVVVVQPGIIVTRFGEVAAASVDGAGDGDGDAYAAFNGAIARMTAQTYERGPLRRLGGGPERVAAVIETAITAERVRPRYPVTPSARLLMATRRLLSDRLWDRFLAGRYPRP